MIKLFVIKYGIFRIDIGLSQSDLLGLFQSDITGWLPFSGIIRVIVILINGHNTGRKVQRLYRILRAGTQISQELITGNHGAGLQLNNDVPFIAVNILYKISSFTDFRHQFS